MMSHCLLIFLLLEEQEQEKVGRFTPGVNVNTRGEPSLVNANVVEFVHAYSSTKQSLTG